jgi:hypothetical protein
MCQQKMSDGASLREEKACPDCPMMKNRPEMGLERLVELSTISYGCTGRRQFGSFDQAQNGIGAAQIAQFLAHACTRLPAEFKAHLSERLLQAQGEFDMRQRERREAFGKDLRTQVLS